MDNQIVSNKSLVVKPAARVVIRGVICAVPVPDLRLLCSLQDEYEIARDQVEQAIISYANARSAENADAVQDCFEVLAAVTERRLRADEMAIARWRVAEPVRPSAGIIRCE